MTADIENGLTFYGPRESRCVFRQWRSGNSNVSSEWSPESEPAGAGAENGLALGKRAKEIGSDEFRHMTAYAIEGLYSLRRQQRRCHGQ